MRMNLKRRLAHRTIALAGALTLGACASLSGGPFGALQKINYAAGSPLGAQLPDRDAAALSGVFLSAMESGKTGAGQRWSNGGARGEIVPGAYAIANLKNDPDLRLAARDGLDLSHPMETGQGLFVMVRNSNVRSGPSTQRRIVEVLPSGVGVDVAGKIVGQPWMLIAVDGRVIGYVHENLLIRAPGAALELAGGPRRVPKRCREFTQRLSMFGQSDEWRGAACEENGAWRLAPPQQDSELLREPLGP